MSSEVYGTLPLISISDLGLMFDPNLNVKNSRLSSLIVILSRSLAIKNFASRAPTELNLYIITISKSMDTFLTFF